MHICNDFIVLGGLGLLILCHEHTASEVQAVAGGQQGQQLLALALIIQHRNLGCLRRPKLLPLRAVPQCDCQGSLQQAAIS